MFLLRWSSLLSHCMGGSSLLVDDEVEHLHGVFEGWGSSVHIYYERTLFSLLEIKMQTYQTVQELSRMKLSSLT